MKISKKQLRKIISESVRFSGNRFGFKGPGWGEANSFDPYKRSRSNTLTEDEEREPIAKATEDAWAGGENLENPVEQIGDIGKVELVKEPETLDLTMSESLLRKIIKNALLKGSQ